MSVRSKYGFASLLLVCAIIVAGFIVPAVARDGGRATRQPIVGLVESPDTTSAAKPSLVIPDSLRATYKYTEGIKQIRINQDTAAAHALYREALAIDKDYAPALYQLSADVALHNPQQAVEYAQRAYQIDTMNRWYASAYGRTLVLNGRYDDALPIFRRLTRLDRNNPDNYRILAVLYQQRKQPYSAIAILDSADMRFGKIAYLADMKRHLLISTNQIDRAISEAEELVESAPYEQANQLALAETYAAAKRDSLARVTYKRALRIDSTNVQALGSYADFCSEQRDMKEYLRALRILYAQDGFPLDRKIDLFLQLTADRKFYGDNFYALGAMVSTLAVRYPTNKRVIDLYGDHLIAGGDLDGALKLFKSHLTDEPPQMDFYMAVIDIEEYQNRPDSVDRYVQMAMERFPDDPIFYIRKANRQYVRGDLHGAISSFNEAQTIARTDSLQGELWGYIGDTYNAIKERVEKGDRGDTTEYKLRLSAKKAQRLCFEAYDKALALYPDNVMVLNNYAYFLSLRGEDLERAMEMSSRAIELEKNNSTYIDTYAWILYKLGRLEEARTAMRQAISLDTTESAELPLHYGDILFALGENFMAETYWRKALELGGDVEKIEKRFAISKSGQKGRIEDLLKK